MEASLLDMVVLGLYATWWWEIVYGGKLYEYRNSLHPLSINRWTLVRVSGPVTKPLPGCPKTTQLVLGAILLGPPVSSPRTDGSVFRPEWGCDFGLNAYPILDYCVFDRPFDLGYTQVLAGYYRGGLYSGKTLQDIERSKLNKAGG